jgi:hypothetical protein
MYSEFLREGAVCWNSRTVFLTGSVGAKIRFTRVLSGKFIVARYQNWLEHIRTPYHHYYNFFHEILICVYS